MCKHVHCASSASGLGATLEYCFAANEYLDFVAVAGGLRVPTEGE